MVKRTKRLFAALLVVVMVVCALPLTTTVTALENEIIGSCVIETGDTYYLASDAANLTITIATQEAVTIVGNGCDYNSVSPNENVFIDCTVFGVTLVLENVWLSSTGSTMKNLINFTGTGNTLNISGISVLDHDLDFSPYAALHVPYGAALTINGPGPLYFYKNTQGAGIGGDENERGGSISLNNLNLYAKGTRQGATIGNGANSNGAISGLASGDISITGCELYLIPNSRGAAIGGSAGSSGATPGGYVSIYDSVITVNVDFSGAAIGGGGFNAGNDSRGGDMVTSGSSIKSYIDKNAVNYWSWAGVTDVGVNGNVAVKADVYDLNDNWLACLELDLDELGIEASGAVLVRDITQATPVEIYNGGLHRFRYVLDGFDRDNGSGGALPTNIEYTLDNWIPSDDNSIYLYLTRTNHTLEVEGKVVEVLCQNGEFVIAGEPEPTVVRGDVDGNGIITSNDATLVFQAASKMVQFTTAQELAADVDGNGIISSNDATLIFQYASKLINKFPADNN